MMLTFALPARAWGPEGHEIVARIAAAHLTPAAAEGLRALLGPRFTAQSNLIHFASWADWQVRARPQTRVWHYVDIEVETAGFDRTRDCPAGACVVAQIERDAHDLANPSLPRTARAEALKFLIHLVGDLHQPLHCADRHDRGGNQVDVTMGDDDTNLHRVWDSDEVAQLGEDPAAVAEALDDRSPAQARAIMRGSVIDWANESFAIARDRIYARLPANIIDVVTPAQLRRDSAIAGRQLERAGLRLAMLINAAFAPRSDRRVGR